MFVLHAKKSRVKVFARFRLRLWDVGERTRILSHHEKIYVGSFLLLPLLFRPDFS